METGVGKAQGEELVGKCQRSQRKNSDVCVQNQEPGAKGRKQNKDMEWQNNHDCIPGVSLTKGPCPYKK